MGWTGIQYSALRAASALCIAAIALRQLSDAGGLAGWLWIATLPMTLGLLIGLRDRALALSLLVVVTVAAAMGGHGLLSPAGQGLLFTSAMLGLHALTPAAPFGSFDARGRVDPRGDWSRPVRVERLAWILLALAHGFRLHTLASGGGPRLEGMPGVDGLSIVLMGVDLLFIAATIVPALRTPIWITACVIELALAAFPPLIPGGAAFLLLHLFAANPGWWPGRPLAGHAQPNAAPGEPARLYYDGDCGFCHRAVLFVLSEDANTPPTHTLRFAPLAGPTFERQVASRHDLRVEALPDSIVLALEDGRLLTRSAAVLEIASRLGGLWRAVALIGDALPTAPLDAAYDAIARVRSRLFAQPKEACPILPPDLRRRFDP